MTYQIELSINLKQATNLSELKKLLVTKAEECKVEDYYTMYEHFGKNRTVYRNHCILTFLFTENDELLAEFINYSKKFKNISIESVGLDKGLFKLIYASKNY